ncbi:MAG: rhodanese-like domain-containing protein, partial [Hyphomicrobiaceae bacterium]
LRGDDEFALIDPREEGDFAHGHLLSASNLPFSRLELLIGDAVPGRSTPIVLVDDLSGPAERAATLLSELGYSDVSILMGGVAAWHVSGFALFSGVNVPGKAFGEWVEYHLRPPAISAEALKDRLDANDPILLIDTRTPEEHADDCIPGALLCPNGELPVRALAMIADRNTTVVAHCAGRTRSIIGAQTLIDLGVSQPVFALENGTVGWEEIGAELERGAHRPLPLTDDSRDAGRDSTARLVRSAGLAEITMETLAEMQADLERTIILLDVRTCEEFCAGHVPGARNVPGGQLIQNIDKAAIVKNSRIVLTDDDGARITLVAFWLKRMGFGDVHMLPTAPDDRTQQGVAAREIGTVDDEVLHLSDAELVVDIRSSLAYRRGHVPGSWFLSRANLERDLANLPAPGPIAVIADDAAYAELMARDLRLSDFQPFVVLDGFETWKAAGGAIETGFTRLASPPNDMWYDGEHLQHAADAARENRRYIAWEKALIDDIVGEPSVRYL